MKVLAATVISFALVVSIQSPQTLTVTRSGSQPARRGPAENWMEQVTNEQYRGQTMKQRDGSRDRAANTVRLGLKVADRTITATLIDSETARDFVSLLPLTLTMNDLFRREKFGHLPRAISRAGKPTHTYAVGDIAYWSPGPDVAVYYRQDGEEIPNPGIIVIGRIDSLRGGFRCAGLPESDDRGA